MLGIGNHPVHTLGEVYLDISIGNKILKHNFHVVLDNFPVEADGVIGNDFLTLNNAIINYGSNKLIIKNHSIDMLCSKIYKGCKNMLIIPPRTEMVIPVKIISNLEEGFIEGKSIIDGLFCPSALVKANDMNIGYTTVLNTTENEIIVKNMKARLKPVDLNVQYLQPSEPDKIENSQRFNEILELLRLQHLNQEEKNSLMKIFRNYHDLFHLEHELLTATNVVQVVLYNMRFTLIQKPP